MAGLPKWCPDYDNDEAMAALGRVCVDIFLNVQWNGHQEKHEERIKNALYTNVSGACEESMEDSLDDEVGDD